MSAKGYWGRNDNPSRYGKQLELAMESRANKIASAVGSEQAEELLCYQEWPEYGNGKYKHYPYKDSTTVLLQRYIQSCPLVDKNNPAIRAALRGLECVPKVYRKATSDSSSTESEYSSSEDVFDGGSRVEERNIARCDFFCDQKTNAKMDALRWELGYIDEQESVRDLGLRETMEYFMSKRLDEYPVRRVKWAALESLLTTLKNNTDQEMKNQRSVLVPMMRSLRSETPLRHVEIDRLKDLYDELVVCRNEQSVFLGKLVGMLSRGCAAVDVCLGHYRNGRKRLQLYKRYHPSEQPLFDEYAHIEEAHQRYQNLLREARCWREGDRDSSALLHGGSRGYFDPNFCGEIFSYLEDVGYSTMNDEYSSSEDVPTEYRTGRGEEQWSAKHITMREQLGVRDLTSKQVARINGFGLRYALDHHRKSALHRLERKKQREQRRASKRYRRQRHVRRNREQRRQAELEKRAREYATLSDSTGPDE
jgi:hypothetical protein